MAEKDYGNNKKTINMTFKKTPTLHLVPIWIRYTVGGQKQVVDLTMPYNMSTYLENILPVGQIQWHYVSGRYVDWNKQIGPSASSWGDILKKVTDLRKKNSSAPSDAHWYAMVPFKVAQGSISGYGSLPGKVAAGRVPLHHENLEDTADIMAHELGHNFGRHHAPCGTTDGLDGSYPYANARLGDNGWDPQVAAGGKVQSIPGGWVVPANSVDVMSYCQDEWISEYNYRAILTYRGTTPAAAAANGRPSETRGVRDSATGTQPYLFASGTITGGQAVLDPWAIMERATGFDDGPGAGSYRLRLAATDDTTLFERFFDVEAFMPSGPAGLGSAPAAGEATAFYEVLPWNPSAATVQVWVGDALLTERTVSAHAPDVSVLAPAPGVAWTGDGEYVIEWQGSDQDGDLLWFDVEFSRDGGTTWEMLATRLQESTLPVSGGQFPGTDAALFRVYASDGLLTSEATVGPISIEAKPPQALITSPQDGAVVPPGVPIPLKGYAFDPEDGQVATLLWESNRDGSLGAGSQVMAGGLSPGEHTITLTATDSDDNVAGESVRLLVGFRVNLPLILK